MRAAAAAVRPKSLASVTKSRRESRSSFATGDAAWPLSVAVIQPSARTWSWSWRISACSRHRIANASACSGTSRPSAISVGATRDQNAAAAGTDETQSGTGIPDAGGTALTLRYMVFRPRFVSLLPGLGAGPRLPIFQNSPLIRAEGTRGFP